MAKFYNKLAQPDADRRDEVWKINLHVLVQASALFCTCSLPTCMIVCSHKSYMHRVVNAQCTHTHVHNNLVVCLALLSKANILILTCTHVHTYTLSLESNILHA